MGGWAAGARPLTPVLPRLQPMPRPAASRTTPPTTAANAIHARRLAEEPGLPPGGGQPPGGGLPPCPQPGYVGPPVGLSGGPGKGEEGAPGGCQPIVGGGEGNIGPPEGSWASRSPSNIVISLLVGGVRRLPGALFGISSNHHSSNAASEI